MSLTGIDIPGVFNYVDYAASSSSGNFDFLAGGSSDFLSFTGSSFTEGIYSGSNFKISRVPEGATVSLLFAMGLGVWAFARKLPTKKQSRS